MTRRSTNAHWISLFMLENGLMTYFDGGVACGQSGRVTLDIGTSLVSWVFMTV